MFKKKKPNNLNYLPIAKGLYAWTVLHAGSFLLYVESMEDYYKFLFLPGPSEYFITTEDFTKYIKSNSLEFVEELPDEIFSETVKFSLNSPQKNMILNKNEK